MNTNTSKSRPELDGVVSAARGHDGARRMETHAVHGTDQSMNNQYEHAPKKHDNDSSSVRGVLVKGVNAVVRVHVPHFHSFVVAAGRRQPRVRAEARAPHPIAVAEQRRHETLALQVPNLTTRGQQGQGKETAPLRSCRRQP